MKALEAQQVTKRFGGLVAVNEVSLEVNQGEIFSIIGPNGAGKTTFFNLLTGIYAPDEGRILLFGKDVTGFSPDRIAKEGVGRTFQNIRLFGAMTVLENILVGMHIHIHVPYFHALLRTPWPGGRRGGPRRRRKGFWTTWASSTGRTSWPETSPTGSKGGWRSPGPWPSNPGSSSWTSPRRA
jgi:hypothetical protein